MLFSREPGSHFFTQAKKELGEDPWSHDPRNEPGLGYHAQVQATIQLTCCMSQDLAAKLAASGPLEVLAPLVGLLPLHGGCEDDQGEDEDDAGLHFE